MTTTTNMLSLSTTLLIGLALGLLLAAPWATAQVDPYIQQRQLEFFQQQLELLKIAPPGTIKIIALPCP